MITVQRIERTFDTFEHLIVHLAIKLTPWLIDILPAFLAYKNFTEVLDYPLWIAGGSGLAVELLGLGCASQALKFRRYNKTKRVSDPSAPESIAWAMTGVYFGSSLTICLLGAFPQLSLVSFLTFPLMGAVGTLVHAMEQDHQDRLATIARDKAEKREERAQRRAEKQAMVAQAEAIAQQAEQGLAQAVDKPSTREQVLGYFLRNPLARQQDAANALHISRQAVSQHLQALEKAGTIRRNGHGVEIAA